MIEQRLSKIQQEVKEFVKGVDLLARLALDPTTDPMIVSFMQKRRAGFAEKNLSDRLIGDKNG